MKITLAGRKFFLLMALMPISFIFNSCRKDLLVQGPDSLRSSLSIAEAKSYFNSHITAGKGENTKARVMFSTASGPSLADVLNNKQPMWDHAFQKMMATGQAVKIPIDFGDRAYAMVSGYKKEVVPLSSLNYLFMYRDSLQKIHAEWVVLLPDSAWLYGNRNTYTGRIWVRDWVGNTLKNYYYGSRQSKSSKGSRVTNSESGVENEESQICIVVPTGNCPKIGVCSDGCDMCFRVCAKQFCGWIPVCGPECELPIEPSVGGSTGSGNGSGGGNPGGNGSGGGAGPSDYPPACNPDPNYIPIFPPGGGGSWQMPCNGPETVPMPQPISLPPDILWTPEEVDFLSQYPEIQSAINNYLSHHPNSPDAVDFAKWAVGYLYEFQDADIIELIANDNIPNANINLPILDTSELTNYPVFKALVEDLPNFLNSYPNVLQALEITTGLKQKKIKELMQPGKGPKVRVINNLKDEYGNNVIGQYDDQNRILKIDKGYVNDLSKANTPIKYKGLGLILTITTLHEFVHYGRNISNLPKRMAGLKTGKGSFEAGVYFEDIIMPPGASPLEPATAHGWLRYYNIKYRE